MRELETIFLYEPPEAGPDGLELPKFGVRLACPVFKLADFGPVFLDVMRSMRAMISSNPNADVPEKELPETFEFVEVIQQYFNMDFSFEYQSSVVTDATLGLTAGVAIGGSATGIFFGKSATFGARLDWSPEVGDSTLETLKGFIDDPMKVLTVGGLALEVSLSNVIAAVPILYFYGKFTATDFLLEAAASIQFRDANLDVRFSMEYTLPIGDGEGSFDVMLYTNVSLPQLGTVFLDGHVDLGEGSSRALAEVHNPMDSGGRRLGLVDAEWTYSLTARISIVVFGFCMDGEISGDSTTKEFSADMTLAFDRLGYFSFVGTVSPSAIYIDGEYKVPVSNSTDGMLQVIIKGIVNVIRGDNRVISITDDDDAGIIGTAVSNALNMVACKPVSHYLSCPSPHSALSPRPITSPPRVALVRSLTLPG